MKEIQEFKEEKEIEISEIKNKLNGIEGYYKLLGWILTLSTQSLKLACSFFIFLSAKKSLLWLNLNWYYVAKALKY